MVGMETFHLIVILLAGLITSWWMIDVSDALLNGEGFNKFFSGEWMQLFKFLLILGFIGRIWWVSLEDTKNVVNYVFQQFNCEPIEFGGEEDEFNE